MFVDLVSSLRCLTPHADTWLVAVTRRVVARGIVDGTLGCPTCRREYPVVDGVAYFGVAPPAGGAPAGADAMGDAAEDDAYRIAAYLGLAEPGGTVLLGGEWGRLASALARLTTVQLLLVDPPFAARGEGEWLSVVRSGGAIPLAEGALRGAVLDESTSGAATVAAAARALRDEGRLVAPASATIPDEVAELARDDALWVGERRPRPGPAVPIVRARRPSA
jgi:hypothetical protein